MKRSVILTFSGAGPAESVEHYIRCALREYGPYLGLRNHPCSDGLQVTRIQWKEDDMARLRGRNISIKFDLPREVDDDTIVDFFFTAIEDKIAALSEGQEDHALHDGVHIRQIAYNGEKWEL